MKIAPARAESFVRRPDPRAHAVLVYGPDSGLVRERSRRLVEQALDGDMSDPFRFVEIGAENLVDDPARLADEAAALSLTGGRRAVLIRAAGDSLTEMFQTFLSDPKGESLIVLEARNLAKRSSLRKLFEESAHAAALPCYGDEGAVLVAFIRENLRQHGVGVSREALSLLALNLGSDRMVTRNELSKLALYVREGGEVGLKDVLACVIDSSNLTLEDIAYAVGGGDIGALERNLTRAFLEGALPPAIVRRTSGHFQRLHLVGGRMAAGEPLERAISALKPPLFFKLKDKFRAQLGLWPPTRAQDALERLLAAEIECKSTALPAQAICRRTLTSLALTASQRGGS